MMKRYASHTALLSGVLARALRTLPTIVMVLAVVSLASCTDEGDPQPPAADPQPVRFEAALERTSSVAATRAPLATLETLKATGFYVYANATNGVSEVKTPFMNDQLVTWNSTASTLRWEYAPLKVWPTNDQARVDFYFVYKGSTAAGSYDADNIRVQTDWYNRPQTQFRVNDIVSRQTDMLWAAPLLSESAAAHTLGGDPVRFGVHHALAGFHFSIKLADGGTYTGYTITVKSLTVKGFFAPRAQVRPDETSIERAYQLEGDWIERSYTIYSNGDQEIAPAVSADAASPTGITTTEQDLTGAKGTLMLLPFGQDYTVELEYQVAGPEGTGVHKTEKKNVTSTDLKAGNMLETLLILTPNLDITPGPSNEGDVDLKVTLIDWVDVNAGNLEITFE